MSSKYDFGGNGSSENSGDRGYAPNYKIAPFIKMYGEPSRLSVGNSDWGQSIAVTYENGKLYDGILTVRQDKDEYKVFSWNDAPVLEDETLDCSQLPPVLNKSYAGNSYKYEILGARLEGDDEVGYGDDAFVKGEDYEGTDPIPLVDMTGDDRFTVWEAASEDGPNSSAKLTSKVLSSFGNEAIVDEDSQFGWLADNIELRPELVGMGLIYAKVQKESNESEYSFNVPVFLDAETGNQLRVGENDGGSPESSEDTSSGSSESNDTDDTSDTSGSSDGPVAEFYETCKELSIDTEPAVLGLLEDMVDDADNDLTESMVDRDEILGDLVA